MRSRSRRERTGIGIRSRRESYLAEAVDLVLIPLRDHRGKMPRHNVEVVHLRHKIYTVPRDHRLDFCFFALSVSLLAVMAGVFNKKEVFVKGKDVIKILKNKGWILDRTNGSHHIMIKEGYRPVPVPVHPRRDIPKGLLSALEKQTGVDLVND